VLECGLFIAGVRIMLELHLCAPLYLDVLLTGLCWQYTGAAKGWRTAAAMGWRKAAVMAAIACSYGQSFR